MDDKAPNSSNPSPIIYVNPNKKYGLIFNKTATASKPKPMDTAVARQKPVAKPCIFGDEEEDDDDLDEEDKTKTTKKPTSLQVNTGSNLLKKQTQIEIEKALHQDPTAFEYDEIYDKLEEQKNKIDPKAAAAKEKSNEPKYIAGIMKAAAKRQMEFEKLQERKVAKERQAEGDLWKDKEVFVTSAYKKKLEERERIEAEERNQEKIEELLDVRKQKDLSGFYYSMLRMRTGELVIEEESEKEKRAKEEENVKFKEQKAAKQTKSYRTAGKEEEEEEEEEPDKEKSEAPTENEPANQTSSDTPEIKQEKMENEEGSKIASTDENKEKIEVPESEVKEEEKMSVEEIIKAKEEKRKERLKKMFEKRTIGEKFDRELSEYFIRKNQNLSLKHFIERE